MTQMTLGGTNMAYETKVILAAVAEIVRNNKDRESIYKALMRLANVEGVVLEPLEPQNEKECDCDA